MKRILFVLSLLLFGTPVLSQGVASERIVTFHFASGNAMFYIPWHDNDAQLAALYSLVDQYRVDITSGRIPIYVDGYCASLATKKENINVAYIRANRVKSELIVHKGLLEEHFITRNLTASYEGNKDIVVVTIRIPAPPQPEPQPEPEPQPQPQPISEPLPQPAPMPMIDPIKRDYNFALRTNLLYDAALLPTLGVEARIGGRFGIKVDGSYSYWGDDTGDVQKMWMVSPEIRWYLGRNKRFYTGVGVNIGESNIHNYLIGTLHLEKDTGYQGSFYGAGIVAGYQLPLSRRLAIDLNIGLGYTRFEYTTYTIINNTRICQCVDVTKELWGPTQAGVSIVWKLGGPK